VKGNGTILHFVSLLFFSLIFGKLAVYISLFSEEEKMGGMGHSPHTPSLSSRGFCSSIFYL
jgi:hypothetical protein